MIKAGRLRHRVIIQKKQSTQDLNNGAEIVEWVDVATVWAAIEPLSAREFISAQAIQSLITTKIIMRRRKDIDASMRLYHESTSQTYDIHGELQDKDSGLEYMTLPCSTGVKVYNPPDSDCPFVVHNGLYVLHKGNYITVCPVSDCDFVTHNGNPVLNLGAYVVSCPDSDCGFVTHNGNIISHNGVNVINCDTYPCNQITNNGVTVTNAGDNVLNCVIFSNVTNNSNGVTNSGVQIVNAL